MFYSFFCFDMIQLSMTPCTPRHQHFRLLSLLVSILVSTGVLFFICLAVGQRAGWITFALVAPECLLLALRTTHVIARYIMYLKSFHPSAHQLSQGYLSFFTTTKTFDVLKLQKNNDFIPTYRLLDHRMESNVVLRGIVGRDFVLGCGFGPSCKKNMNKYFNLDSPPT